MHKGKGPMKEEGASMAYYYYYYYNMAPSSPLLSFPHAKSSLPWLPTTSKPIPRLRPSGNRSFLAVSCLPQGNPNPNPNPNNNSNNSNPNEAELAARLREELNKSLQDKELFKDLNAAADRVSSARRELEAIREQEARAAEIQSQIESIDAADSMVEECQREVFAAESELKAAELELVMARAGDSATDLMRKWETDGIDEDVERIESGKAAAISAFVGTLASLPISLSSGTFLLLDKVFLLISCALFGVTYRYAVRRDLGNTQLKAGSAAAFALVRGLAEIDTTQVSEGFIMGDWLKVLPALTVIAENLLVFGFAFAALDFCLRENFLNPFPSKKIEK